MGHKMFERRDQPRPRHLQWRKASAQALTIWRRPAGDDDDAKLDRDLLPLFALAWIASIVRVAGALVRAETFGTEPTLALLFVLGLPWLLKDVWRA
jgi:hypothetical protein